MPTSSMSTAKSFDKFAPMERTLLLPIRDTSFQEIKLAISMPTIFQKDIPNAVIVKSLPNK